MRIVAGEFRGRKLKTLPGLKVRPTADKVKEAVFSAVNPYVYDCLFLDVFGGCGNMALEALSRGAQRAVIIEKDRQAQEIISANIALCQAQEKCELVKKDCLIALKELGERRAKFNLIYVDPPYQGGLYEQVLALIAQGQLLDKEGLMMVESERDFSLKIDENIWQVVKEKYYGNTKVTTLAWKEN